MGGNATAHVGTTRKSAEEYKEIGALVLQNLALHEAGVHLNPVVIPSYMNKDTHGDIDILVVSEAKGYDWNLFIRETFRPHALLNNGGVTSFDFRGIQVDLIAVPEEHYEFALSYFSYNDLGNLMGRIAHKMGFKYGHDGLTLVMRDNTHVYAEISVTRSPEAAMTFLGYDYARFTQGFDDLQDLFEYASSTPYFSRAIFQLDNRNNISRVRDRKRKTYMEFLKWVEHRDDLDKHQWTAYTGDVQTQERKDEKAHWLTQAFNSFPGLFDHVAIAVATYDKRKAIKVKWNGHVVSAATGLVEGKELGQFMAFYRDGFAEDQELRLVLDGKQPELFEDWVLDTSEAALDASIKAVYNSWLTRGI